MKTPEEILQEITQIHDIWSSKYGTDEHYAELIKILTDWGKELCYKQKDNVADEVMKIEVITSFGELEKTILDAPLPECLTSQEDKPQ